MTENKNFPSNTNINNTLDLYFQICSILFDTESMTVIASTFANSG